MSNLIYIPDLNPVHFVEIAPVELPQYLSRLYMDYQFIKTIRDWQEPAIYCQKYQTSDICPLQFLSNFDPVQVDVIDNNGRNYLSLDAIQKRQNKYLPGWFAYELTISWATFGDGTYYIKVTAGGAEIMISEPIQIAVKHPNTLYYEYSNSRYHGYVLFETGIIFAFRVEGKIGRLVPGTKDYTYENQKFNPAILSSRTYKNFKINLGGPAGVPEWVVEKINAIYSCNSVKIDGKSYAKMSETKYDITEEEDYPLYWMNFEIRQGDNRGSKIISPDINTNVQIGIVYNIETSKIFGDIPSTSSNIIQITGSE